MRYETGKHHRQPAVYLEDREGNRVTEYQFSHWIDDHMSKVYSILTMSHGQVSTHQHITPAECRAFAASLLAHADSIEAHQAQLDAEAACARA